LVRITAAWGGGSVAEDVLGEDGMGGLLRAEAGNRWASTSDPTFSMTRAMAAARLRMWLARCAAVDRL